MYIKIEFKQYNMPTLQQKKHIIKQILKLYHGYLLNEYYLNGYYVMYVHYVNKVFCKGKIKELEKQKQIQKLCNNSLQYYNCKVEHDLYSRMQYFKKLDINDVKFVKFKK